MTTSFRIATVIALVSASFALLLVGRALLLEAPPIPEGGPHPFALDEGAPERLAGALRFRTVSLEDPEARDLEEWMRFHRYLEESFPRIHRTLRVETVSRYSLLYTWEGTDPALAPILLSAHIDVVPAESASLDRWTHPPFAGVIADGHVWGRGALDMKGPLVAILEAVEGLLAHGLQPRRTVILSFGHDEELGGWEGARKMVELLDRRGLHPDWVLDEGSAIASGLFPEIAGPIGLVGTAEKGYLTVELVSRDRGGHSSVPGEGTAVGNVSRAVAHLEDNPFPPRIEGPVRELLLTLAPHMDARSRIFASNLWLLEGPIARELASEPLTASLVRTTTAPTMIEAGMRENVLPTEATALVNFRLAPWDTVESVLERVRAEVAEMGVEVRIRDEAVTAFPPTPASSTGSEGYRLLRASIHRVFPEVVVVTPFLVFVATDARHYTEIARDVYRFAPFRADPATLEQIHGIDERIAIDDYLAMVRFYAELIRRGGEG